MDGKHSPSGQPGLIVWLTGLSSAGKTTLGTLLVRHFLARGYRAELLDGDAMRLALGKELGYTNEDRVENVRRIAFVAGLLARNGCLAVVSAISPNRAARDAVRRSEGRFIEVHVHAPVEVCQARDRKGLYRQAREGTVSNVTGIDDPYEHPLAPEVVCHTDRETVQESAERIIQYVEQTLSELSPVRSCS